MSENKKQNNSHNWKVMYRKHIKNSTYLWSLKYPVISVAPKLELFVAGIYSNSAW